MDRVAVMLDERGQPQQFEGLTITAPMPSPSMRREAHVSGNQVDCLHCPFCGSGGIVARSDGSIECTFCDSAFTVTVSPMYPSFPMSVGGQDYQWPGRPGDPSMMGDPNAAAGGNDGYGGSLIPGGGAGADPDGDGDGDANPFAGGGDAGDAAPDSDGQDDTEAEVGGKKKPPFGKKSSARLYRTASGVPVPEHEFLRHLAITTAANPNKMAAQVRQERRG